MDPCVSVLANQCNVNALAPKKQKTNLRKDVQEAIDRAWPEDIVEMSFDSDESYFHAVHPKLTRAFDRIQHARLLHEREADGEPIWWDQSIPEEDPPDDRNRKHAVRIGSFRNSLNSGPPRLLPQPEGSVAAP